MIYLAQKIKNHKTIKAKHQNGDFEMAYEIDFIGVNSEKSTKDACVGGLEYHSTEQQLTK